jgi:hypothetical protein
MATTLAIYRFMGAMGGSKETVGLDDLRIAFQFGPGQSSASLPSGNGSAGGPTGSPTESGSMKGPSGPATPPSSQEGMGALPSHSFRADPATLRSKATWFGAFGGKITKAES